MKYYGKEKCRILKQIRAEIARENDIEWVVSECKHQGNCRGTCPRCEQEVRQLEEALARREALGKRVAVVGISAGIALSVTGCDAFRATGGEPMPSPGDFVIDPPEQETETMISEGEYEETDTMPPESESEETVPTPMGAVEELPPEGE